MSTLLSRQYNLGPRVGALKTQTARAMFYLALPQLPVGLIAATPQLQKWFPNLSFWFLVAILALYYVVVGMWLDYKFMILSENSYNNRQAYKAENPYVEDVREIKNRLTAIEERLK